MANMLWLPESFAELDEYKNRQERVGVALGKNRLSSPLSKHLVRDIHVICATPPLNLFNRILWLDALTIENPERFGTINQCNLIPFDIFVHVSSSEFWPDYENWSGLNKINDPISCVPVAVDSKSSSDLFRSDWVGSNKIAGISARDNVPPAVHPRDLPRSPIHCR